MKESDIMGVLEVKQVSGSRRRPPDDGRHHR